MLKKYYDCKNRCACCADAETGEVQHAYKRVRTTTTVPLGGEFTIEREDTVTILKRIDAREFEIMSYIKAA